MSNCRNTETAAILAFFAGAALAAGAAMLLTPKSGREMREKLGDVTDDAVGKIKDAVREVRLRAGQKSPQEGGEYEGGRCWI